MSPKDVLTLINCLLVWMFKSGPLSGSADDLNALLLALPINVMPSIVYSKLSVTLCECQYFVILAQNIVADRLYS